MTTFYFLQHLITHKESGEPKKQQRCANAVWEDPTKRFLSSHSVGTDRQRIVGPCQRYAYTECHSTVISVVFVFVLRSPSATVSSVCVGMCWPPAWAHPGWAPGRPRWCPWRAFGGSRPCWSSATPPGRWAARQSDFAALSSAVACSPQNAPPPSCPPLPPSACAGSIQSVFGEIYTHAGAKMYRQTQAKRLYQSKRLFIYVKNNHSHLVQQIF